MRRAIAAFLNRHAAKNVDAKRPVLGERLYKLALRVDPTWSVPWYNLGLQAKYRGRWQESYELNQRAHLLDPSDESACWNLGIAATALRNWPEARRAWRDYGIELSTEQGEVRMPPVQACVRLNPDEAGEVVWGERLDPARIAILSVPLPESGHRFHDIVLHDGASGGTRVDSNGKEVPVFNELSIWQVSEYSTYRVALQVPGEEAIQPLVDLCVQEKLGVEDWSTLRVLCAECSRGNPGPHNCPAKLQEDGARVFGFAAKQQEELEKMLHDWRSAFAGADFKETKLVLPAKRN